MPRTAEGEESSMAAVRDGNTFVPALSLREG